MKPLKHISPAVDVAASLIIHLVWFYHTVPDYTYSHAINKHPPPLPPARVGPPYYKTSDLKDEMLLSHSGHQQMSSAANKMQGLPVPSSLTGASCLRYHSS